MDENSDNHAGDGAYDILAEALAADSVTTAHGETIDLEPARQQSLEYASAPAAGLAGIESLPGRVRRRLEPMLAGGERVECVVEGRNKAGTRYLVATTQRVIALGGGREPQSLSLPYHRTEPAALSDTVITLSCNEFGTAVSATIEPRDGTTLEVSHILDRLASA